MQFLTFWVTLMAVYLFNSFTFTLKRGKHQEGGALSTLFLQKSDYCILENAYLLSITFYAVLSQIHFFAID